jgi:hypothetical protein
MPGYGRGGIDRVGQSPFISARDNDPTRVGAQDAPMAARLLSVQPWDAQPIPTATNWFTTELVNLVLAAPAGSTVTTTQAGGGAIKLPANCIASIQAVILFCDTPSLTTSITYTVRQNTVPIAGLTNLKFPPQGAGFINQGFPGPWNVLLPGAFIDVVITRLVADVAKQVNFSMIGWYNSPQDVLRWTGAQPGQV